jgi:hypothetical protein
MAFVSKRYFVKPTATPNILTGYVTVYGAWVANVGATPVYCGTTGVTDAIGIRLAPRSVTHFEILDNATNDIVRFISPTAVTGEIRVLLADSG